jgi:hypothetical protein
VGTNYKVRYTDGDSHERREDNIVKNLVDRNHEDQQAKQKIASMAPSSDEEDAEGSTQPFVEDDVEINDWNTVDTSERSAAQEQQRSSPPAEAVAGPAAVQE